MDESIKKQMTPGVTVKVTQQIAARDHTWISETVGIILKYEQRTTGSWFAHSKNDKLWLDRLLLKKSDGELITLNLDEFSLVEMA